MNECQDRQIDRYTWTSTKHPSVCVYACWIWSARQRQSHKQCQTAMRMCVCVYFLCISAGTQREKHWHWIKRGSLHLIFHSILVPARNPYLLFMSWLSYGGCLFYSMSFVGPPELSSTVLKHRHPRAQQFNSRLEPLTVDQSHIQRLRNIKLVTKIRKHFLSFTLKRSERLLMLMIVFFLIKCEYFVTETSV